MKFNELTDMMQKPEPKPDTYEAGMALNQLLKIGTHAIKIHNMIDDAAEMEAWVAKKIDLASNYVKSVHGYTAGSKAGTYDDDGMSEARLQSNWAVSFQMPKGNHRRNSFASKDDAIKFANTVKSKGGTVDSMKLVLGKNADDLSTSVKSLEMKRMPKGTGTMQGVKEDAGEGHMSKSQLYQTAKMAIELLDMIRKGDDLEGWVQTKLNLAADYLQAVYHYEDYQKLNPYREELDSSLMQRHAGIIQKHLDEILERKCRAEDVDTKPGMMRILKKRVNEVEKEIAKENRKETNEAQLEEGIKEWGKRLAMAGVIVAGLAGVNSINSAIDNSIPAISAMNSALEMAKEKGNDDLAKMIEKDLSDAKIRLNSGKDLSHVADLQDKYAKFIKTEGLAYESRLAVNLKQRLK
tara:strand:+ start:5037 stop:6260 length:1224 start_codon:yes stop_codon:yes gene_type:complete